MNRYTIPALMMGLVLGATTVMAKTDYACGKDTGFADQTACEKAAEESFVKCMGTVDGGDTVDPAPAEDTSAGDELTKNGLPTEYRCEKKRDEHMAACKANCGKAHAPQHTTKKAQN
ncbi:MAG: hypothetical protein ACK5O7_01855 [Holosporales bacterium]